MGFTKDRVHPWIVVGLCLFILRVSSPGSVSNMAEDGDMWRGFGTLLLYQMGTGRHLSAERLDLGLRVVDPDSGEAVRAAESILQQASRGYGHDALAREGRISLDIHPQCILGLCLAQQFPHRRLGKWGREQFAVSAEQAILAALPTVEGSCSDRLAKVLLTSEETQGHISRSAFAPAEVPYLCLYLMYRADSEDVRNRAWMHLASCLWEGYGLEPGLGQYLALLNQGYDVDGTCLDAAAWLERIGAYSAAKRIYTRMLETTASVDLARQSFEGLARILSREARLEETMTAGDILVRRFRDVGSTEHVKQILDRLREQHAETVGRLMEDLSRMRRGPQLLQLYRRLGSLWSPEEAPRRWRAVTDGAERESLAEELARVFHARAMLTSGEVKAAESAIRKLARAANPVVRAQSLIVSAEIAYAAGRWPESMRLYDEALQTDRPTYLPEWCKGYLQVQSSPAEASVAGLQAQGCFLKACNDLVDGSYVTAVDGLRRLAEDRASLPANLQRVLPCALMLGCLGMEDYVEAEAWGYQAIEAYYEADRSDNEAVELLATIHRMDVAVCRVLGEARKWGTDGAVDPSGLRYAIEVVEASATLDTLTASADPVRAGVSQLYARARKRHVAQVLTTEFRHLRQLAAEKGAGRSSPQSELLLFAALVLEDSSEDRIRGDLASLPGATDTTDESLCRFAFFARKARRLDLAMKALDAVTGSRSSHAYVGALEEFAGAYLAISDHRQAIDVYRQVAAHSTDPDRTQNVLLRIIDIYAENLKDYGKAIEVCEELVSSAPDGTVARQVEFAMGRFAYLQGDYRGAVGQFEGFLKRYPDDDRTGQAMLLIGLSEMAEGKTTNAIHWFAEIIRRYPDGELAARSKFLTGYAQISDQQYTTALETFQQLIEQFPNSQYVPQAEGLMERLRRVSR